MADLFKKDPDNVGLHLRNIYKSGEFIEKATTGKYSEVQKEGNTLEASVYLCVSLRSLFQSMFQSQH